MVSAGVLKGGHGAKPITPEMVEQFEQWEEAGVPRREMGRRTGVSLRRITLVLGKRPPRQVGNPRPVQTIYCHHQQFEEAARIAKDLGYFITAGDTAGEGSVGGLVEAIGDGKLRVTR